MCKVESMRQVVLECGCTLKCSRNISANRLSSKLCLSTKANALVMCVNQPAVYYQWNPLKCCQGDVDSQRHSTAPLWFGNEKRNTGETKINPLLVFEIHVSLFEIISNEWDIKSLNKSSRFLDYTLKLSILHSTWLKRTLNISWRVHLPSFSGVSPQRGALLHHLLTHH